MKYKIEIAKSEKHLYAKCSENVSMQLALNIARDLTKKGNELNIFSCLLDYRGFKSIANLSEQYSFAHNEGSKAGFDIKWQIALLRDPEDNSSAFLETLMKNAGFNMKLFDDEKMAIKWLEQFQ